MNNASRLDYLRKTRISLPSNAPEDIAERYQGLRLSLHYNVRLSPTADDGSIKRIAYMTQIGVHLIPHAIPSLFDLVIMLTAEGMPNGKLADTARELGSNAIALSHLLHQYAGYHWNTFHGTEVRKEVLAPLPPMPLSELLSRSSAISSFNYIGYDTWPRELGFE